LPPGRILSLIDHGVDEAFVGQLLDAQKRFMALPESTKALIDKSQSRHFRGWERVGAELTNNKVDWREQFDLSTEHSPYPEDAVPHYLRLDGPNQWLAEEMCPGFKTVILEYVQRMKVIADELMVAMGAALELPEGLDSVASLESDLTR